MIQPRADIPEAGLAQSRSSASVESIKALFAEVNRLANQLRKGVEDSESVRLGPRSILEVLGNDGPLTVPEIARVRSTSRQNIQMLVNRLEAEGCVELVSNPAHRRSALVRITDRGRTVRATVSAEERSSFDKVLPHIAESELTAATDSLRRIRSLLAGIEPVPRPVRKVKPATPKASARLPAKAPVAVTPPPTKAAKEVSDEDFPVNLL